MGEYGLDERRARRFPHTWVTPAWQAYGRRSARKSLNLMEDMLAISGLQSEVEVEGEKKKPKGKKTKPVGYLRHREKRIREGFPTKKPRWSLDKERQANAAFWGFDEDDAAVVLKVKKKKKGAEDGSG